MGAGQHLDLTKIIERERVRKEQATVLKRSIIQRYRRRGGAGQEDGRGMVDRIGKRPGECGGLKAMRRSIFTRNDY